MYKNSIIYEIVCNITGERYIGSTKRRLNQRMCQHKELRYSSKQIIERNNYTEEYVKQWHKDNYIKKKEHLLHLGKIWTENNKEHKKEYHKILYDYKCSWGEMAWGHPFDNNLLKIDINIFN